MWAHYWSDLNGICYQRVTQVQYELINLTRVDTAENKKLLRKLNHDLIQLNESFFLISRETILLRNDKDFILTMF